METTFSIVKPDAFAAGNAGNIIAMIQEAGFKLRGLKLLHLSQSEAEGFYAVHKERPFFGELVEFMTSGPVVVMALAKENAVADLRSLMGPTNAAEAPEGTVRHKYGADIQNNAIHGSDSPENAAIELAYFFAQTELHG